MATVIGSTGNSTINGTTNSGTGTAGNGTTTTGNADTIYGDSSILGSAADLAGGNDTIDGGGGNDLIYGQGGNDTILGGAGSDVIFGGDGNDRLYGNDTGGTGTEADTLDGGAGNDTILGAGGADSISGGADNDSIVAGDGADTVDAGTGNDSIDGGAGDDSLFGGAGADSIIGGTGADVYVGGAGADTLQGQDNNDTLSYDGDTVGVTINLGANSVSGGDAQGDVISSAGSGGHFQNARGGSGNDYLTGTTDVDNAMDGGAGNDTLVSNLGDTLYGGSGNDSLVGESATGATNQDLLIGGSGNDTIDGRGGSDRIYGDDTGGGVNDTPGGADLLIGGVNVETIWGGGGNDTIYSTGGADTIEAGAGNDLGFWSSGGGNDSMRGGDGTDTLNLSNWAGPNISTDLITNSIYGSGANIWTVSGTAADRIFASTLNGGTTIHASSWEAIVCFAAGTRIATARGEVAVESLRIGDLVVTGGRGPALQPVMWLGHTKAEVARHPDRAAVAPVLVKAGALGKGVPFRDLRVSPDHALFLDGQLVPAKYLVNGSSIIQELWCPAVEYWHVEMPAHTLLVSEGALTESYLDDGNRMNFDNGPIAKLFKDFESERENGIYDREACYPVLRGGEKLDAIRAKLAALVEAPAKAAPKATRRA